MPLSRDAFATWLDAYVAAWRSNDAAEIGALFSQDCSYSYRAGTDVVIGRDAIVADWLKEPDDPSSWDARYEPLAVDGEVHVATGWSRYFREDGGLRDEYSNVFVCRFDEAGQCSDFMEWWMRVGPAEAA
jgi:SnoaL-like domain